MTQLKGEFFKSGGFGTCFGILVAQRSHNHPVSTFLKFFNCKAQLVSTFKNHCQLLAHLATTGAFFSASSADKHNGYVAGPVFANKYTKHCKKCESCPTHLNVSFSLKGQLPNVPQMTSLKSIIGRNVRKLEVIHQHVGGYVQAPTSLQITNINNSLTRYAIIQINNYAKSTKWSNNTWLAFDRTYMN